MLSKEEIKLAVFGRAWEKLIEAYPDVGGFIVFHDAKEIFADKNTIAILGEKSCGSYETFTAMLESMKNFSSNATSIGVTYIDVKEFPGVSAGIIMIKETDYNARLAAIFEFAPKSALVKQLNAVGESRSALMLIQLSQGGTDYSVYAAFSALTAIKEILDESAVICPHYKQQFWIYLPKLDNEPEELAAKLREKIKRCDITDEFGVLISSEHNMKLTAGISIAEAGTENSSVERMHEANFALFEAGTKNGGICIFSPEQYELQKEDYHSILRFMRLIEQNLFMYHFQPIVSARSGDIVAYEALMRTDASIGMNPLQILELAEKNDRLYDIERATFFNTLAILSENQEIFENRKLFVNAIPSQILNEEDYKALEAKYGELLEKVVVELTEQTEISDEKLKYIQQRLKAGNMQLAIDDYGTGYSNTSNLIRYDPDIVKIDRSLIADIDKKEKNRGIVSGIIDFLHASGYIALAEGVETAEELYTLINMSADLIQGYYVSMPKPVLLHEVSKSIKEEIIKINLEASGQIQKIYRTSGNETIDLSALALEKYTDVFIDSGRVTLIGDKDRPAHIGLTVKDNANVQIVLHGVNIDVDAGRSALRLGSSSKAELIIEGDNVIGKLGIFVPRSASIKLSGSGNLTIVSEEEDCYAIGCPSELSCGNILIDISGRLDLIVNGDKCACIGGGRNDDNNSITILGGALNITCTGGYCVGIGFITGNANINISDCGIVMKILAANSVGIGSAEGDLDVRIENFSIEYSSSGNRLCGIGTLGGKEGSLVFSRGQFSTKMNGKNIVCAGSNGADIDLKMEHSMFRIYAEGGSITGIGDRTGSGDVTVLQSELNVTLCTGNGFAIGSESGKVSIEGGTKTIKINE